MKPESLPFASVYQRTAANARVVGLLVFLGFSTIGVGSAAAQIVVPQAPGALTPAATPAAPVEPKIVKAEVERKGRIGREVILGTYLTLTKECKVGATPKIEYPSPPQHGKMVTRTSAINLRQVPGAPRGNCIGTSPNGILVAYRPERRFSGEDVIVFKVVYPNGDAREVTAKVVIQ